MLRFSLLSLMVLSACGPAEDVADAGSFPLFPNQPNTPGSFGGGGSVDSAGGGNGEIGGGVGGGAGGGASASVDAGSRVNLAEKVWVAQENVFRTSVYLRGSYGVNAVSWLKAARDAAGTPVTTGAIVENADGSVSYAPGGTNLRITSKSGRNFVLKVYSLIGDVRAADFPRQGESVDVAWVFSSGEARCGLRYRAAEFTGIFVSEHDELINVNLQDATESTIYSNSDYSRTDVFGTSTYSGWVEFEDRRVDISTQVVYSVCGGSACGSDAAQDYAFSHATKLTMDGAVWNLNYTTGWTMPSVGIEYVRWEGTITGPGAGQLVRSPVVGTSVSTLDVFIGADRYTTRAVPNP